MSPRCKRTINNTTGIRSGIVENPLVGEGFNLFAMIQAINLTRSLYDRGAIKFVIGFVISHLFPTRVARARATFLSDIIGPRSFYCTIAGFSDRPITQQKSRRDSRAIPMLDGRQIV